MTGVKGRSGRRPMPEGGRRIYKTMRLAPETDAFIRQTMAIEFCTYAQAIDTLVAIAKQELDRAHAAGITPPPARSARP